MTRKCLNCNFENQDYYDYCAKCGTPLVEGVQPKQFYVYKGQPQINKSLIISTYILTIFLSWGAVLLTLISKTTTMGFFSFFGFFMPFYLVQSNSKEIRLHGYIQLAISLIGVLVSLYLFL